MSWMLSEINADTKPAPRTLASVTPCETHALWMNCDCIEKAKAEQLDAAKQSAEHYAIHKLLFALESDLTLMHENSACRKYCCYEEGRCGEWSEDGTRVTVTKCTCGRIGSFDQAKGHLEMLKGLLK